MNYITLESESLAALEGAKRRVAQARTALGDFLLQHGGGVDDETLFVCSPELRPSLEREYSMLSFELDEATRWFRKCEQDLEE